MTLPSSLVMNQTIELAKLKLLKVSHYRPIRTFVRPGGSAALVGI
jgi:hypothetical protein